MSWQIGLPQFLATWALSAPHCFAACDYLSGAGILSWWWLGLRNGQRATIASRGLFRVGNIEVVGFALQEEADVIRAAVDDCLAAVTAELALDLRTLSGVTVARDYRRAL